jgi:hypothetical protein
MKRKINDVVNIYPLSQSIVLPLYPYTNHLMFSPDRPPYLKQVDISIVDLRRVDEWHNKQTDQQSPKMKQEPLGTVFLQYCKRYQFNRNVQQNQ